MADENWYRGPKWKPSDQEEFFLRLKRVRHPYSKAQNVRIKAYYLLRARKTKAALELLDYLLANCPHKSDLASAHDLRGECLIKLDRVEDAIDAYRDALAAEKAEPHHITGAGMTFAWLVTTRGRTDLYKEAARYLRSRDTILAACFPADRYVEAVAWAFIKEHEGDSDAAAEWAKKALEHATQKHSGFRYHPKLGLVKKNKLIQEINTRLKRLASPARRKLAPPKKKRRSRASK